MGKTNKKRASQNQENNVGCTWGLIRMFYSRRDPKLILDRQQGSRRHSFSGFAGRGRSRKKSRDFDEIDEGGDNMEECSTMKPTVRRLMQGELGKLKPPKKIPNDEVQRILADLGHDVCLDKNTMQNGKANGDTNPNGNGDITIASSCGSLDPSSSKNMKQAEEDNLELALSDFLGEVALSDFMGEVYKYHDEGPSDDCMSNSELCPELKSVINTKLDEFSNPLCDLAYKKILVSEEKELVDNKHLKNRYVGTMLESRKMIERTNIIEDTKSSNQHELAIKARNKESKNIFFWKKDKSSRRHTPERSSQPVNKIVILKPNPKGGFCPTATTQAPGYSEAECSTFSVKEVRRRFRIVTGENRKGKLNEDGVQGDPCRLRDSVFTIKKDSRQVPPATAKNDPKRSNISKQKQINDELGGINSEISTSKDASIFYAEAKKHLTEILKDKSHTDKYPSPTVQISRSLVRMLSLPQCSTSSPPRSSPRARKCIELSPEDKDVCAVHKAEREEPANGRNESEEDQGSVECGISEALDEQVDQGRHYNQEATQHGVELDDVCIEEVDKTDHSETIHNVQCIPAEQDRYSSPEIMEGAGQSKEHDEMFLGSPENVVEKLEHQDPETPRPSVSLELISQEQNPEKQEKPSPVSVLDPLLYRDAGSPDNRSTIKCELRQNVLRPQYYLDAGSYQEIFWEDSDARLGYIKAVLELSELYTHNNPEIWHLKDELISTCLFEELHQDNQTDDVKLFFDCVCEAITAVQGTHFRNPPCLHFLLAHNIKAAPMGHNLISEINKHIEGQLCYQFASTLNQLVDKDLKDCSWMDLQWESGDVAADIWEFLLDELLEDVAYDLLILN